MRRLARQSRLEFAIEAAIRVMGFSAIGFVTLIFLFLLREGAPAFYRLSPGALFGTRWYPTFDLYGTLPLILGSLLVTAGAVIIAFPLGLGTAVFVREVAP
ncbi:MAG: phosphate ABC transporter permease subunit PstC, partial [Chloroflexi bacterium]|nr:phosphate ABC transporter permease subunit PstC [Chloroflexota bacterium]